MEIGIIDKLNDYFQGQPVKYAWLFGSVARGDTGENSDVDILVDFDENVGLFKYSSMIEDLERILKRAVDLVSVSALFPWVEESVNRDKILIYEREA